MYYNYFQDGSKVFMAGCDQMAKCWDLASDQCIQVLILTVYLILGFLF